MPSKPSQITDQFILACTKGDIEEVRNTCKLIEDPYYIRWGLRSAIRAKKLDVIECLLPLVDARGDESEFLQMACEGGHVGMVNLLIPHSNPKANHSVCFRIAIIKGHTDVVNCLWDVVDVSGALKWFKENTEMFIDFKAVNERLKVEEEKKYLKDNLKTPEKDNRKKHKI